MTFVLGNAEALSAAPSIDAAKFDAVVCNYGILHLSDPDAFLRESCKVLRPGGRVAFTCWNAPPATTGMDIVLKAVGQHGNLQGSLPDGPPFFAFADAETSAHALSAAGFTDARLQVHPQMLHLDDADGLFLMFEQATARTRALLHVQTRAALAEIRKGMARHVAAEFSQGQPPPPEKQGVAFGSGDKAARYHLPMPCAVSSARKPASDEP